VVADAPLGEVVGADALAALPGATWLRRSAAMAAACSSCARSSSRAFSTPQGLCAFLICERSSWQVTTSPVGRW